MSIEVRGLTKVYGAQKALDNISFQVKSGEIVGFLGPNGAGKSTTMKIITGYLKPDGGNACVNLLDVQTHNIEIKKITGYLPEANPLYLEMYVREYLEFIAGLNNITKSVRKKKVQEVISLTGLISESNKKIGQLSKGYKQRVGLAGALIHDPEVLILDEPTSGLDPNQIIEIREVIKKLGAYKTVLFSTHILQEVEAICNRVVILNKGKIVSDTTLQNLQNGREQHSVRVVFKTPINKNLLDSIHDVESLDQENEITFCLNTRKPEEVRRELLELSLKHNLNIVSLQSETESLENIFKHLTK